MSERSENPVEEDIGYIEPDERTSRNIEALLGQGSVFEEPNGQLRMVLPFNEDGEMNHYEKLAWSVLPRLRGGFTVKSLRKRLREARDVLGENYEIRNLNGASKKELMRMYSGVRSYVWKEVEKHAPEVAEEIKRENERRKNSSYRYR